jgi:DNA-binding CsgD family transcriptional regulator
MCTAMIHKVAGLYWVVSMYRHDIDKPFTEEERAATEVVVPHVFAAARQARLGELRASTRVSETHGQSSAIVSEEGIVFEFEPTLVDLLRQQWPNWTGPWLPADLWSELRETPRARVTIGTLVVRSDAFDGGRLIHVRRAVAADRLTVREREIAEGFSLGETYKELGERFGISPNTVRRHLANIYEKLGIASKAELDRMLSGLG